MNFHLLPKNGMEDGYNSVCFKKEPILVIIIIIIIIIMREQTNRC